MMPQRTVSHFLRFPILDQLDVAHARGRTQVIHDRVRLIETLCGEHVLISDAFVFVSRPLPIPMKPDVVLPRDFSQSLVIRHSRILLLFARGKRSTPHPPPLLFVEERRPTRAHSRLITMLLRAIASPLEGERTEVTGKLF